MARGLLAHPTATFLEHGPASHVRAFAHARPELRLREDRAGNLLLTLGLPRSKPKLVLVAHLDHPAFIVDRVEGRVAELSFRGGVRLAHAKRGTKLAFFRPGESRAKARGVLVEARGRPGRTPPMLAGARARIVSGGARDGDLAMWDFPAFAIARGRIISRCCDDLLGAAAALAALDELRASPGAAPSVAALFTRAEEVGFFGTFEAIRLRTVPKDAFVLSIETSRALPHAPQGGGVIVRVGDARSVFDPPFMGVLHDVAKELVAVDSSFRFQRKLMDGGSCEATAFCAAGYRAGGVALPLGNYHNMAGLDGGRASIGPEHVRIDDYLAMVRLLVELGRTASDLPRRAARAGHGLRSLAREARDALRSAPRLERSPLRSPRNP